MTHQHIQKRKSESGQIIIIVAFLMIAMIAMLGLAIDGGGLMFLQRDVQNAADNAIVAGVYARCSSGDDTQVIYAARQSAKANGFEHGVDSVTVNVDPNYNPPGVPVDPNVKYIRVSITAPKDTYFIQIVYSDPLSITTESVGRCNVSTTTASAANKALFAACQNSGNGIQIQPGPSCSGEVIGGVHSNSDAQSGPGFCGSGDITASGSTDDLKGTYNGNNLPGEATSGVPIVDFPVDWDLTDYNTPSAKYPARIIAQWGGNNYSNAAGLAGFSEKVDEVPAALMALGLADPRVEPVLLYVNGDFEIKGGKNSGTLYLTVVATGQIEFTGSIKNWNFENAGTSPGGLWYNGGADNGLDYLLFYSDVYNPHGGCKAAGQGSTAIGFSMNEGHWNGILYAPRGDVRVSASSSQTSFGAIWAQAVFYSVSDMSLTWDPNVFPPVVNPPTGGIAK